MFFGNLRCGSCATELYYSPPGDRFVVGAVGCAHRGSVEACNWEAFRDGYCLSCDLDRDPEPHALRAPFQEAKRRTLRQLMRAEVVILESRPRLVFDIREGSGQAPVTTGHADGVITIDASEGDPARREKVRTAMDEPYRTPVGHVRHELGHWYWQAFLGTAFTAEEFRAVFGDERASYAEALERHYSRSDDGSWRERFVSHYAAAHPWEDFAESFAHYLHLTGTLETADSYLGAGTPDPDEDFAEMYARWARLSSALNELNRSMGTADPYPFAPNAAAVAKIRFVHESLPRSRAGVG